ncbi:MAG: DUF1771 domain-containing protein [Oligoflexales bacterium]|nr:DUF1771 domain-containing protein [Oligoflexales bacterium]
MILNVLKTLSKLLGKVFKSQETTPSNNTKKEPTKRPKVSKKTKVSRELANQYAQKRHECFQKSQEAFKNGDKAEAAALSKKGKEWGEKMHEMNALVVKSIIDPQQSEKTGIIDLHGLFVKEAETAVKDFLKHHLRNQKKNYLEIITGAGNNSAVKNQPVIRPAVEQILKQHNLQFELVHGDGAFLVILKEKKLSQVN